jgi:hypothetical protein
VRVCGVRELGLISEFCVCVRDVPVVNSRLCVCVCVCVFVCVCVCPLVMTSLRVHPCCCVQAARATSVPRRVAIPLRIGCNTQKRSLCFTNDVTI